VPPTRTARRLASLLAAATVACVAAAPPAAAATEVLDAACQHNASVTYSPGLTLTPRPVEAHATGTLSPCVSTQVTSGTMSTMATGTLSCLNGGFAGSLTFAWVTPSGGDATSVVTLSGQTAGGSLLAVGLTGTVTSGLFAGDSYAATFAADPLALLGCVTPAGMTSIMGTGTSTFVHPLP
jgi:hypothetical protein